MNINSVKRVFIGRLKGVLSAILLLSGLWLGAAGCMAQADDGLPTMLLGALTSASNTGRGDIITASSALTQEDYRNLAEYWSPRLYQDTDDSYYKGDYITKFNFDGDYNGRNNWENLSNYSTVPAYVYYAVSETTTHYFISYFFFHPRDWHEWLSPDRHENDLEGIVLAVKKGGTYGTLTAMQTQAHGHQYQYAHAAGITSGTDNIDGTVSLYGGSHPRVFIEAKGHGVYNCDSRCNSAPGGDGIVYYQGANAASPSGGNGNWTRQYSYRMIAMDADGSLDGNQGFWHRRNDICSTCTFGTWGKINGDNYGTNKANAPWAWDDSDDGQSYVGDVSCDPAKLFDIHLNGTPFDSGFSHTYVNHIYRTHYVQIYSVRSDKNRDPWGGKSDIYARVTAPGPPAGTDQVINTSAWKKNSASTGNWYTFRYGAYDAEGERRFGANVNSHSFCRQGSPGIKFSVYDSDSDADDHMGTKTLYGSANYSGGIDLGDGRLKFRMIKY